MIWLDSFFVKSSSSDLRLFGAGRDGLLLGAGGGEGNGRHNGVIGELITISALSDWECSLVALCIGRDEGGIAL